MLELLRNDDETFELLAESLEISDDDQTLALRNALLNLRERGRVRSYRAVSADSRGWRDAVWWSAVFPQN